uniref:Trace amine associated receptor 5 n=1 Tax=Aquila chrysaetos chrysaetos TaxID=223781 RepID=A0A663EUN7_AQUCH
MGKVGIISSYFTTWVPSAEKGMLVSLCYKANGSCYRTLHPFGVQLAIYLACALGTLITVLGKLLVVIVVSHFKALHKPTNPLLLSLYYTCWYFRDDFCRPHTFLDTLFCLTSIFHLCFISIDWHCAICDPLLYPTKFTVRVACIYIGVGWAVSVAYTSVFLYTKATAEGPGRFLQDLPCVGSCQLLFNKIWGWLNFPVFFFPCLVMVVLYVKIFTVANKQARPINNMSMSIRSQLHVGASKAARTLGVTVGVYLLFLFDLIWFAYFSSACNPLIYVFSYRWFRKNAGKLRCLFSSKLHGKILYYS